MNDLDLTSYGAFTLRIANGVLFLAHGLLKLLVFTPSGTAAYFESLGLPAIAAYLTIIAEIGGGLALIAGYRTRLVAIALVPILIGAAVLVHAENGWLFSNQGGGWEFPVYWAVTLIVLAFLGEGAFAVRSLRMRPA